VRACTFTSRSARRSARTATSRDAGGRGTAACLRRGIGARRPGRRGRPRVRHRLPRRRHSVGAVAGPAGRGSGGVRAALRVDDGAWTFLEINPEDVSVTSVCAWRELGVRTVSLGVQSLTTPRSARSAAPHRDDARRASTGCARAGLPPYRLTSSTAFRPERRRLAPPARGGRGPVGRPPVLLPADHPPGHGVRPPAGARLPRRGRRAGPG